LIPLVSISVRMPCELLEKLEEKITIKQFKDRSEAIRSYVELGLHVESYRSSIKDPEFLKSMEDLRQDDKIFEWMSSLKENELTAIKTAIELEREIRSKRGL
jgi:Arc/MetJ-type ribon-helix-helix transcriptional regulator